MKEKEILENNKLIADFMGVKIGVESYSWRSGCTEPLQERHLNYHASWGWLMSVLEKIDNIDGGAYQTIIYSVSCHIIVDKDTSFMGTGKKIDAVYQAVIDFVNWNNSQHK